MVYLKIPIGNEAHDDTTFIHIHGRYSVVNMQYSYAKYKHIHIQHVAQATATIRNESVHMQSLARAFR